MNPDAARHGRERAHANVLTFRHGALEQQAHAISAIKHHPQAGEVRRCVSVLSANVGKNWYIHRIHASVSAWR